MLIHDTPLSENEAFKKSLDDMMFSECVYEIVEQDDDNTTLILNKTLVEFAEQNGMTKSDTKYMMKSVSHYSKTETYLLCAAWVEKVEGVIGSTLKGRLEPPAGKLDFFRLTLTAWINRRSESLN